MGALCNSVCQCLLVPLSSSRFVLSFLQILYTPPSLITIKTTEVPLEEEPPISATVPNFEPPFVGVNRDFSNRLPQYLSDITDGLNARPSLPFSFSSSPVRRRPLALASCWAARRAIPWASLKWWPAPVLSGVLCALCSAQPVQLIGPQGPVVAYIAALYPLAKMLGLPFLQLYASAGLCASAFLALFALVSASNVVQHLTRWTDEIFSVLVSTIFLVQAVTDVSTTFAAAGPPVTALLTLVSCSLTFGTAMMLRSLNRTNYLTQSIRKNLANFAPAVGVVIGSLATRVARLNWGAALPALQLPSEFVTSSGRPWLLSLATTTPSKLWMGALPAGLAAAILLYLDQTITARLVGQTTNRRGTLP
ncbi:Band 3 anion transport protein [Seminavis robusta]|uniref:Band 3 anion transport protein n=1 Tax=Seminavis robusta TaxID=568900 RepID=A0A9N8DJP5_9STRA|nr:Band 3 anion transport protein [Seminavis robusta]|eukprot:Sro96_g049680.1 Band 3 anion transport protein (364) ;mRNA; f:99070-100161